MSTRVASILERPHVRMILAVYSWAGFVASLTVHVGALCGIDLTRGVPAPVIALHAGIFPAFAAAVLALRSELVDVQQRDAMHHLMRRLPLVWRGLFALLFVYALVNFIVSVRADDAVSRIRLFSGHWAVFYLLPALVFGVRRVPEARERAGWMPPQPAQSSMARQSRPLVRPGRRLIAVVLGAAVLGLAWFNGARDSSVWVNTAAFVVPTVLLVAFAPDLLGRREAGSRKWSYRQPLVIGWMLSTFLGASLFATWFETIPPQRVVTCKAYRSHGWKLGATLERGRYVYLPYLLPGDACTAPTCPPLGTVVQRRRGELGTWVGERFYPDDAGSWRSMLFISGLGMILVIVGLVMRRREGAAEPG